MYMPNPASYYIYKSILSTHDKKINNKIIKDAIHIYGFKPVYFSGYIKNLKLYNCVDRKILEKSKLLSERTINIIYKKIEY